MTRRTMKPWLLAPALLLAGFVWIGAAHAQAPVPDSPESGPLLAQRDDAFDGPGGMSAPAPAPRDRDRARMNRAPGEHRMRGAKGRRGGGTDHGRMGGMKGMKGMHGKHGMRGMGGMRGMRGHGGMMGHDLDLTDRQKEQMAQLRETHQRRMIGIRSGLAEARLDLGKLMRADSPNQSQIDATIDRMAKLRADAHKARVATMLGARGLMTPEQRKKMQETRGSGHGSKRGA